MPQDAFTLRKVAKELNGLLCGGKINKINQPVKDEVDLTVYAGGKTHRVVLSANASTARVGISSLERENPLVCYAFCMLLRKHLTGATLEKVEQVASDRVIAFTLSNKNDLRIESKKVLYAEIMGKYSNLILTEEGKILGAIKTASLDESRKRVVMTNFPYAPPPSQEKTDPFDEEKMLPLLSSYLTALANGTAPAFGEWLFKNVKGLAFSTALECAERATGNADLHTLYGKLLAFLTDDLSRPCVLKAEGKNVDFFPFPYRTLTGEYTFYPDLLSAQNAFYTEKEGRGLLEEGKRRLSSAVKNHENKLRRRLAVILQKEQDCADMETLRKKGEILLSNLWAIPQGAKEVTLPDYYSEDENATVRIVLDDNLTPQENANRLFKRYDKEKKTLIAVAPQKKDTLDELSYLDSLYAEIERVEKPSDFAEIEAELTSFGILKKSGVKKQKPAPAKPLHFRYMEYDIFVGKNNVQNDALVSSSKGGDLWLHTKDFHSSHVIVVNRGEPFPDAVIGVSAELCAHYSSARGTGKVPVDYTLRKYVKKPSGSRPGFVIYTDQQTTFVSSNAHEDLRV